MGQLTDLFSSYQPGNREAFDRIVSAVYPDLVRMARSRLRGGRRLTLLDTSAVVHEFYLRALQNGQIEVSNRAHFMAYTARVMRSIIVDFARQRQAARHGGDLIKVEFMTDFEDGDGYPEERVMEIADAVDALSKIDERLASVVEMQFFAGFTPAEIGKLLGVNERTVRRDFEKARLLLSVELR
jgi:RNA polymerase sigma factor (TIGR02999 family)